MSDETAIKPTQADRDLKAELDRLSAAATQGEWIVRSDVTAWANWISAEDGRADLGEIGAGWSVSDMPEAEANTALIVALVNAYRAGEIGPTAPLQETLMPEIDLKPCPFCGQRASLHRGSKATWVCCTNCWALEGRRFALGSEGDAIAAWNQRADTGISRRDWFAGRALTGLIARTSGGDHLHGLPATSYAIADAMIAESAQ